MRKFLLRILYFSQVWRIWRWYNRNNVLIRTYHGVTEFEVPNWTQLRAGEFDDQMRYLRKNHNPISLTQALDMLSGKIPLVTHSVVVTFDDGFKNNATTAYPILKKYQIPATIFLTTSFVDKSPQFGKLIWTDYIYCLLESTRLGELDLRDEGLGRFDLNSQESKYAAKGFICEWLKKLDSERKNLVIRKLTERLSCPVTPEQEQIFGSMDWGDVQRLDREGLVMFGAHTVNHEILSQLPDDKAKWELTESQRIIESKVNRPVPLFAYPNGQPDDFTETVQATVRAHYRCALTTLPESNSVGDDLYMLKRTGVGRGLALWEFELLMAGVPQG